MESTGRGISKKAHAKEETPVACAAPFRRQGFGHVLSKPNVESLSIYLTGGKTRPAPVKYKKKQRSSQAARRLT